MSSTPSPEASQSIVDTITDGLRPIRRAAFALGSNLGDSLETLQGAVDALLESPAITAYGVSPVYRTDPVGGPDGQPDFLNAVLVVDTTLAAAALLERAHAVEEAFGRSRADEVPSGPRTLDIDLLAVGDRELTEAHVVVPHPRAHERSFVLAPWADVDPSFAVPGRGRVRDLLERVGRDGVRRVSGVALELP